MFSVFGYLGKFLWKSNSNSLIQIPSGELYVCRISVSKKKKVVRECLFMDCMLTINRKENSSTYELCVQRIYEEGEFELQENENNDENTHYEFDIKESMRFEKFVSGNGGFGFRWSSKPLGTYSKYDDSVYEFIPDKSVISHTIQLFHLTLAQCIYEAKTGKSYTEATTYDLQNLMSVNTETSEVNISEEDEGNLVLYTVKNVDFYVYDPQTQVFNLKEEDLRLDIMKSKKGDFVLQTSDTDETYYYKENIVPSDIQHLDRATTSFVLCHMVVNVCRTVSFKFHSEADLFGFANSYARAAYEILNAISIQESVKKDDIDYILTPFLESMEIESDDESNETEDETDTEQDNDDETEDESGDEESSKNNNSNLVIGKLHDRTFVSRGNSIGVFKNDHKLKFQTNIKNVSIPDSDKPFSPSRMILYDNDTSLVMMNPNEKNKLYRMDLEVGKVVDEWKISDYTNVNNIIPETKDAQMTSNKMLIGHNTNAVFKIDSRLSGDKLVESQSKVYTKAPDFSCGVTSDSGYLALASQKGEIRLYNSINKNAKTLLQGLGDPIVGIDITSDGRYLIATCKTYLLFIDVQFEDKTGKISSGFVKPMGSNKSAPKRLYLMPEHVAYMQTPVNFTKAHFDAGRGEEKAIVTSTGPYVITWNIKHVIKNNVPKYAIKKYSDNVVADNFRYNNNDNIIVTLPHHVTMDSKKNMTTPHKGKFNSRGL